MVDLKNITAHQIFPGDPEMMPPTTFAESLELRKTKAILAAWSDNAAQERNLRIGATTCIFGLIVFEVFAVFTLIFLAAAGVLNPEVGLLKILIPTFALKIVALGWIVVKYLFSEKLKTQFDALLHTPPASKRK